jgi:hypothetical protein
MPSAACKVSTAKKVWREHFQQNRKKACVFGDFFEVHAEMLPARVGVSARRRAHFR